MRRALHTDGCSSAATCPSGHVAQRGLTLLAVLLAPAVASATNPWMTPLGSEAAMSGGAVAAMGRDTGNAWYNPAGLGANTRAQLDMSSTLAVLRYRVIPGAYRIDLPGGSAEASLQSTQALLLATSTVYTRYLGRGVTLGVAHFANNYDVYDYSGRLTDLEGKLGTAYDTHVQVDGWSVHHHFGPTVGWQIRPRFRIGASLFFTYEWLREEGRTWARVGPDADGLDSNFVTGDLDIKRATYAAEAVLGLQWEFVRGFHLGLAVRTPRLAIHEKARRYEVITQSFVQSDGHSSTHIDVHEGVDPALARRGRTAPINIVLGLGYALPKGIGWVSVEGDYSPRLLHERNVVDLRRVINGRVGARVRISEHLHVGLGFFTDRASQNRVETFPQFNISYYGGSMGFEFRRNVKLGAHERARDLQFMTAVAARYAYGVGQSSSVVFSVTGGAKTKIDTDHGIVDPVQFHTWGAHLGAGFYF